MGKNMGGKEDKKVEGRVCQCEIPLNLQVDKMYEKIAEYLSGLEKEDCVEDGVYEERLKKCSACDRLAEGLTCMECGCFVLVRAKKKRLHCPRVGGAEW